MKNEGNNQVLFKAMSVTYFVIGPLPQRSSSVSGGHVAIRMTSFRKRAYWLAVRKFAPSGKRLTYTCLRQKCLNLKIWKCLKRYNSTIYICVSMCEMYWFYPVISFFKLRLKVEPSGIFSYAIKQSMNLNSIQWSDACK